MTPQMFLVNDIPKTLYKQIYYLNLREHGYMRENLIRTRKKKCKKSRVFILYLGDEVCGWSICSPYKKCIDIFEIHVYVKQKYRGCGHGKNLIIFAQDYVNSIDHVYAFFPYNEYTTLFFEQNNLHGGIIFS